VIECIYIEDEIKDHPRTLSILDRFGSTRRIKIKRYGDVFNKKSQNFRLQKSNPALILARKHQGLVLDAPDSFGIGGTKNYYFSHMFNCVYDCRYCFLQGMYSSANYVVFVNYEDFDKNIEDLVSSNPNENLTFFSGYDCDSLALENITGFVEHTLPVFQKFDNAVLELRTKSIQLKPLLEFTPMKNCVIAFSLMPRSMSDSLDHKTPKISERIKAISKLAELGWKIGLRFDPLIHGKDWKILYKELFDEIMLNVPETAIHSVSVGPLRFPKNIFKNISKLYPEEKLFAGPLVNSPRTTSYAENVEKEMTDYCLEHISRFVPKSAIFNCVSTT
tara:strand:+ start:3177 stop:4175 length:999 start_codon:yes stop_codon:yes gene_type:complete